MPSALNLGAKYDVEAVLGAMGHLAVYWDRSRPSAGTRATT